MSEGETKTEAPLEEARPGGERVERLDEDGLPLDRKPTLDDVRGNAGSGRAIAIGCSVLVALVLAAFWLIRAGILG